MAASVKGDTFANLCSFFWSALHGCGTDRSINDAVESVVNDTASRLLVGAACGDVEGGDFLARSFTALFVASKFWGTASQVGLDELLPQFLNLLSGENFYGRSAVMEVYLKAGGSFDLCFDDCAHLVRMILDTEMQMLCLVGFVIPQHE